MLHAKDVRFPLGLLMKISAWRIFLVQGELNSGGGRGTAFGSPCRKILKTEGF